MEISLEQQVELVSEVSVEYASVTVQVTADKSKVAILELVTPRDYIRGSQEVEEDGERFPVFAENVTEVKVHESDFKGNPDFKWNTDTETGVYRGDSLMLDVSKRTGQVWLRSTPFSAAANAFRTENNKKSFSKYTKGKSLGSAVKKTAQPVE